MVTTRGPTTSPPTCKASQKPDGRGGEGAAQLKGTVARLLGPFAKRRLVSMYSKETAAFKTYVEGKYGNAGEVR